MRVIVRRERPHPGAQLDLLEEADGLCYTAFATDTATGRPAHLDARFRAHARVEHWIRCASAWLTAVMIAVDLLAWTQLLPLHGHLAKAEPKILRYRLLHVAARHTCGQRRTRLRIRRYWPWARDLAAAFARIAELPSRPADRLNQK
jgi:hypothetical protein